MNSDQGTEKGTSRLFAEKVLEAFRVAGRLTDTDVAAAGGPSDSYMTSLRKAAQGDLLLAQPRGHTQRRIEAAAGWLPGSALKVWEGQEPEPEAVSLVKKHGRADVMWEPRLQSDRALVERLWELLDERGAIDLMVSEALLAIEQRLSSLRQERNTFAHGSVSSVTKLESVQDLDAIVEMAVTRLFERLHVHDDDTRRALVERVLADSQLPVAADDDETSIEAEQGHDEHP